MHGHKFIALLLLTLALLTACGQTAPSFGQAANKPDDHTSGSTHEHEQAASGGGLQPVLATSELVVGPNRMALGILENNVPIPDAAQTQVHLQYFKLKGDQATPAGEEDARYYGEGLGTRGAFISHPTFDQPGNWGLEVRITRPGKSVETQRIALEVVEKGNAVAVGAQAPRTQTPTTGSVKDIKTITSASKPNPRLYQMSVAQAVSSGKPSLILFATPGFCQTAVCGPGVEVLERLVDKFGDKVNAVHVEVYQYPFDPLKEVEAMHEWGLKTEPWLFLVDKTGRVAGRYEGGITYQELEPAVEKLAQ
jgi:hypothetical protein